MCSQEGGYANGLPFQNYAGYPFYIEKYNQLVSFATQLDPDVAMYFQQLDIGEAGNPGNVGGHMWKSYAELAAMQLDSLATYLQSRVGRKQQQYEQIIDLIRANLRPAMHDDPELNATSRTSWRRSSASVGWTTVASRKASRTPRNATSPTSLLTGSASPSRSSSARPRTARGR